MPDPDDRPDTGARGLWLLIAVVLAGAFGAAFTVLFCQAFLAK